jgi:SEFIR domain
MAPSPKVFISYSHDSPEHAERVLNFANQLRGDGIDAEVDQYEVSPLEGWPAWSERQIEEADFVLMVCTDPYHRRVRGQETQGTGLGVVWEARIIRQSLYDAGAVSDKFIPVVFSGDTPDAIPKPVRGWTWYVVDNDAGYQDLRRRLSGQRSVVRPALGATRGSCSKGPPAAPSATPVREVPAGYESGRPVRASSGQERSGKMSRLGHSFTFHAPVTNVYAPGGNMILNAGSSHDDLAQRLEELRRQIQALTDVDAATRAAVDAKLQAATKEKSGVTVQEQLASAAKTLESAAGAADKGLNLVKTLTDIGKWAATVLL